MKKMQAKIVNRPTYANVIFTLERGESIVAESGSMITMTDSISVKTISHATGGGILRGLKRMLAGESFFNNIYRAEADNQRITIAPSLLGDVVEIDIPPSGLVVQSGSWLAHYGDITMDTKWGGLKTLLGGEGLFMLKLTGRGRAFINAFGAVNKIDITDSFVVDTGHIVAFDGNIDFEIRRVGNWFATFFSGEGFVCRFRGKGSVWIQTRNPVEFGRLLGSKLPPRKE